MRIFLMLLVLWPFAAAADTLDSFYTDPPNPLDLAILGDAKAAKDLVIGPKGGEIKLTSAAGDIFVLTLPEGALLTDTRITATPIGSSAGLPEGAGPITGLILQPDGLELARTATLTITPKTPIPPESRLHWGFYGRGCDAFLHIPVQGTDSIVIPIDHFSGAGVSFADRMNLQLDRWRQTHVENRLRTQMAELVRNVKAGTGSMEEVQNALADGKRLIMARRILLASRGASTCADTTAALNEILAVERQSQLLGSDVDPETIEAGAKLMNDGFAKCLDDALKVCLATGDLSTLVHFALLFERMQQLIGASSGERFLDPAKLSAVRAAMQRCGRYKLTVKAAGHWKDSAGVYGTTDYLVEVPIRLAFNNDTFLDYRLEGEGPATALSVTFVDYACWTLDRSYSANPMQVNLASLEFRKDHTPLRVEVKMKAAEVMAVVTCPTNRFRKTIENDVAWVVWAVAHRKDRVGRGFVLKTMKAGSHPKIFSYSWDGTGSDQGTTASDTTALTLEHIGG